MSDIVKETARKLRVSEKAAQQIIEDLEQAYSCLDDLCNGELMVRRTVGVLKDANGSLIPNNIYYECEECGKGWVYNTRSGTFAQWNP